MDKRQLTYRDLAKEVGISAATLLRIVRDEECLSSSVAKLIVWLICKKEKQP